MSPERRDLLKYLVLLLPLCEIGVGERPGPLYPKCAIEDHRITRRSGSAKGRGRSRVALKTEKIAVVEPIPRAKMKTVSKAKPGLLLSCRSA